MDWSLIVLHALTSGLSEAARQVRSLAEKRHEAGALPDPARAVVTR